MERSHRGGKGSLSGGGHCITYSVPNGLREIIALPILADREQDIWIGSWSKGLAKLPGLNLVSLRNPDREQSFMTTADNAGNLWTATNRGLWKHFATLRAAGPSTCITVFMLTGLFNPPRILSCAIRGAGSGRGQENLPS